MLQGLARFLWACAATLLLPHPATAEAPSPFTCSRAGPDVMVRLDDIPLALRDALPSPIADRDQPWNVGDAMLNPTLPHYRLICGYSDAGSFVMEWEHGGIVRSVGRTVLGSK